VIRSFENVIQTINFSIQSLTFLLMLLIVSLNGAIQADNILVGLVQLLLFLGQLSHQILGGLIASCIIIQQSINFGFQVLDGFVSFSDIAIFTLDDQVLLTDLLLHSHDVVVEIL